MSDQLPVRRDALEPVAVGRASVRVSLTPEAQARAAEVARLLGARTPMTVIFLLLNGKMMELDGRLDADGQAKLDALARAVLGDDEVVRQRSDCPVEGCNDERPHYHREDADWGDHKVYTSQELSQPSVQSEHDD